MVPVRVEESVHRCHGWFRDVPGVTREHEWNRRNTTSLGLRSAFQAKAQGAMDLRVVQMEPKHYLQMERLQKICYPTLGEWELMNRDHFQRHHETFPEGQHVAVDLRTGDVVGMSSGLFVHFDLDHPQHTFQDITQKLTFAGHDPTGEYYYGADISVHPEYRRKGLGSMLYNARKNVAVQRNKRGVIAGGLLPGYGRYKGQMDVRTYVDKVIQGEMVDPTLTFQLRNGFQVRGLLSQYLADSASDNWATLLYWENPDYEPSRTGRRKIAAHPAG